MRSSRDAFSYETSGSGPALVLVPGLAVDVSELTALIGALAGRFAVAAIDNLGAGRSGRPEEPYPFQRMVDGVAVLLDEVVGPAPVLGISLGSRIVLTLALQRPDRVTRLVLASGAARVRRSPLNDVLLSTVPRLPIGRGSHPQSYAAFRRQRMAARPVELRDGLGQITSPALVAHGRRDRVAPPELAIELASRLPHARLRWFDGHIFPFRAADARWLTAETAAFLSAE